MPKVYRNIYFKKNILKSGVGQEDVHYSGHLYSNCESISNFREMYDRNLDLLIPCTDCAAHRYRYFIKVDRN